MGLPWEPSSDAPPNGIGIGISGGGLRSAAFALGVLQALQERRGLLFGERSAELLAVVSGGSYPAATHTLEARRQADEGAPESTASAAPPLAHGSPEERHLLSHAEYFGRARWRFLALTALNVTSLAFLLGWTAWFLADLALIVEFGLEANPHQATLVEPVLGLSPAVLIPATIAGLYLVIRGLYQDGGLPRYALPALGLVLLAVATPGVFRWLDATTGLWTKEVAAAEALILLALQILAFVAPLLARRMGVRGLPAAALNRLAVWSPRLLLLVIVGWFAIAWYRALGAGVEGDPNVDQVAVLLWLFGILIGGLVFSNVPHRASLHREYRERIASGFAVRRRADGGTDAEAVGDALLSGLGPPASGSRRYPRLLVCATANVGAPGPTGRSSFVPFVFSHDRCGVPGHPEAVFDTLRLECVAEPAGLLTARRESLVSLMTAVAATGAGVAPSMGRMTQPSAGMFIAALNIRPGRWLPNPFSRRARDRVSERLVLGPLETDQKMGPGYNELIPEMFRITGSRVYVSDGAHYDNLALMTLLRARCSEIWILDASPEPRGQADEIHRIVSLALEEIGAVIDVDLTPFLAGPDGLYQATAVTGTVTYANGAAARLVVLKLGLTAASPPELRAYGQTDPGFPHHPTTKQVYPEARMEAYRHLGHDTASRFLA